MPRARVLTTFTRASRQTHSRQGVKTIRRTLVRRDTNIALVIVTVRPHAVRGSPVARSTKVTHSPETGPETRYAAVTGEGDTSFEAAAFETQLVPGLEHAGTVFEFVVGEFVEADL